MGKKHCASILVTWQTSNLVHHRDGQNFYLNFYFIVIILKNIDSLRKIW